MYISNILRYFPDEISKVLNNYFEKNNPNLYLTLEEIRLRANKPIILKFNKKEKILEHVVQTEEIIETLRAICENSIYSYQNQICEGFITIKGRTPYWY